MNIDVSNYVLGDKEIEAIRNARNKTKSPPPPPPPKTSRKIPKFPEGTQFIRPIELDWIRRAACLPGKSLHVALFVWYFAGLNEALKDIPINVSRISREIK